MPDKSPKKRHCAPESEERCQFVTASGRKCRMFRAPGHADRCVAHSQMEQMVVRSDATAAQILGPMNEFRCALSVNRALGKIFSLVAENRLPARNAAVLTYTCQLILQTLSTVKHEIYSVRGREANDENILRAIAQEEGESETETSSQDHIGG